ncbi:hypothetical protein ADL27_55055 [Streptomyces sp. NRRL F-6602]|nr:hypothetical protein ADL27_55055 [Streptomyces sp. NRRL F-6602]
MQSIRTAQPTTTTAAPVIPMPGRLLVDYYDWDLHLPYSVPLNEVTPGTVVTTTGTITNVVRLAGGRAMVVLSSDDGNSAHVLLNPDVVRMTAPALYRGYRMHVRGLVRQTSPSQPAGIEGLGVQVEIA